MGKRSVTDAEIVANYGSTNSTYATARQLGLGATTVNRVLVKLGVPREGILKWRQGATKFKGQEAEILEAYNSGMTMLQLSEKFGSATHYAFKSAIKRAGGTLRDNPIPTILPGELEKIKELHASGMGQVGISVALNRSQSFISRAMWKNGIKTHLAKGQNHSMWKGGRITTPDGYVRVWVADDDPMACMRLNDGYVLEHRLVMARKLGRPLLRSETVHHKDLDHGNNAEDNLQLRQGKHGKGTVMCCLECGSLKIGFKDLD